uniref:Uncharacterized protein n=1 Tax=Prolemur simus TaxID=1328070 RepID=A0A8C9DNW7_PROSS
MGLSWVVVLGRGAVATSHMLLPFCLGLGGPIGSGHHFFFPWPHIRDLAGILTLQANHVQGVLNRVAPASSTAGAVFAQALGAALGHPASPPSSQCCASCLWARAGPHAAGGPEGDPAADAGLGLLVFLPRAGAAWKEVIA